MTIQEEYESHFNEPVLMYNRLARVIGYGEDYMDCYLIVQYVGGQVVWNTAVGGYIWLTALKGENQVAPAEGGALWDDFTRLDDYLSLNGAPRQDTFLVSIEPDPPPEQPEP